MHAHFNVARFMTTVQGYVDRDVKVTGNIWLAEDGISYILQKNVILFVIIIRLILATLMCIATVRSGINMTYEIQTCGKISPYPLLP